jgi:integrase
MESGQDVTYPEVANSPNREKYEQAFAHIVEKWGRDFPVKTIWIPEVKQYQVERLNEGAAASTINKERAALSKMFQVLVELRHIDMNRVHLVKPLSEKSSKRQVYISFLDFQKISAHLPDWFRLIAHIAYFTGMRRGEILDLTWKRVDENARMIYLASDDDKEKDWKRIPIHEDLIPIFEELKSQRVVGLERVFIRNGSPITKNQVRMCWERAVAKIYGLHVPLPHFHDLRHTWKTNARRSGMHLEIEKAIMGHKGRAMSFHEGYGRISKEELIGAIDNMTFDHGKTEIWVTEKKTTQQVQAAGLKNGNSRVTGYIKKASNKAEYWRPQGDLNPCRRRERNITYFQRVMLKTVSDENFGTCRFRAQNFLRPLFPF